MILAKNCFKIIYFRSNINYRMGVSFRDSVEERLLALPGVRPLSEREARHIDDFKDGTFGLSYLGFLLYCTGQNPRGLSSNHPKGLLYFDRENLFGLGVFRREGEPGGGHLMAVAPRGLDSFHAVEEFSNSAADAAPQLKGRLFYVRFLQLAQYKQFLQNGYHPVQEEPWHEDAFAEDETFLNSVVRLSDVFEFSDNLNRHSSLHVKSKWNRSSFNRFNTFLSNYSVEWSHDTACGFSDAKKIVDSHFRMLEKAHKRVGSMPEDYWNLLESSYSGKFALLGRLRAKDSDVPVSIFVGEKVSRHKLAIYCCISRRTPDVLQELGLPLDARGFGALSTYAFLNAFAEAKKRFPEVDEIDLGGSETPDLNAFKRRLGARNQPTYWAVKRLA